MTEPAPTVTQTIVQQMVQQLTKPLQDAAKVFSTKVAESMAKDVQGITKSFREAHPAITRATDSMVGWSSAVTKATGAVGGAAGSTVEMIRNTRELRTEVTKILDRIPALDGLRLRFMQISTALRTMNLETIKATASTIRQTVVTRVAAIATTVWTTAKKVLTVVARVLNQVLINNPIGRVVMVISLLVGALVLAYQRSSTFRNIVNAAFNAVRSVATTVFNAIRTAVQVVWPYIQRVIQVVVTIIRAYVTTYFTVVRVVVTTIFNAIRTVITVVWRAISTVVTTYVRAVRTVVTTVFNAVRTVITTIWNGAKKVITDAVSAIVKTVDRIKQVYTVIRDAFNNAKKAVGDAIKGITEFVGTLPEQALNALKGIGTKLVDSGRALIDGFVNGIRNAAGRVVSAIKEFVLDKIPGPVKQFLGISSPSRVMMDIGVNVGEGLAQGIDRSGDYVAQAMQRLVPVPRAAAIRPAVANLAEASLSLSSTAKTAPAAPVTINVHPRERQSEYEIGRITARELAWAAKH